MLEPQIKAIRAAYEAAIKGVEIPRGTILEVTEDQDDFVVTWRLTGEGFHADYAAKVWVDRKSGLVKKILMGS